MSRFRCFRVGLCLTLLMGCESVLSFGPPDGTDADLKLPPNLPLTVDDAGETRTDGGNVSSSVPKNHSEWTTALEPTRQQPEPLKDVMSYSVAGRRRYWYALSNGTYSLVSQQDDEPVVRYLFDAPLAEGAQQQLFAQKFSESRVVTTKRSASQNTTYEMFDATRAYSKVGQVSVSGSSSYHPFSVDGHTLWILNLTDRQLMRWQENESQAQNVFDVSGLALRSPGVFHVVGRRALIREGADTWLLDIGEGRVRRLDLSGYRAAFMEETGTCFVSGTGMPTEQISFIDFQSLNVRNISEELKGLSWSLDEAMPKAHWWNADAESCALAQASLFYVGQAGVFEYSLAEKRVRPVFLDWPDERALSVHVNGNNRIDITVLQSTKVDVYSVTLSALPPFSQD